MYKENYELKALGKRSLQGNWPLAAVVCVVAWLLTGAFTGNNGREAVDYVWQNGQIIETSRSGFNSLASFISFIISGPIYLGLAAFFLKLVRNEEVRFGDLFGGFKYFLNTFLLHLFIVIFTILWFMLLIVPGFVALLKYSMAFYIMRDNPEIGALEAIRQSKELMYGHKTRFFFLWLSFIGWFILGIVTFGLGFLYLLPYYNATKAHFYEDLLEKKLTA